MIEPNCKFLKYVKDFGFVCEIEPQVRDCYRIAPCQCDEGSPCYIPVEKCSKRIPEHYEVNETPNHTVDRVATTAIAFVIILLTLSIFIIRLITRR